MSTTTIPTRAVHFDLKGCPPTAERLIELLTVFAAAGYNAVVVEWEDSFPWTVDRRFRSETAYTPETIRAFCDAAASLQLEVIPLVQCLGHMENPLAISDYAHLREIPWRCVTLNPTAPGARELVQSMVDDVLKLMPGVKRFHLGGDEARGLGSHPNTKAYIEKHGKGAVYMQHVEPILDNLLARGIRPLLWDDMMRHWEDPALDKIAPKADLVVWSYAGHPTSTRGQGEFIKRFQARNITLWGATAYKGAEGPAADLPDIVARTENAANWAEVAREFKMAGLIATAWSRYQTQRVQTIPIDAALDSAVLVGLILSGKAEGEGDVESAHELLRKAGEWENFSRARLAMTALAGLRQRGWAIVQEVRQQLVVNTRDVRRRGAWMEMETLRELRGFLGKSEAIVAQIRHGLKGLMDDQWIDDYIASRMQPLWDEQAAIEPLVRALDPVGYAASGWRMCANSMVDEAKGLHIGA